MLVPTPSSMPRGAHKGRKIQNGQTVSNTPAAAWDAAGESARKRLNRASRTKMLTETELMKLAIKKWGKDSQLDMVVEECAELIKAIQKWRRNNDEMPIIEEAVDVELMLEQLKIIFPAPELRANIRTEKLARLATLLEVNS